MHNECVDAKTGVRMREQGSVAGSEAAARAASEMKLYAEIPQPCSTAAMSCRTRRALFTSDAKQAGEKHIQSRCGSKKLMQSMRTQIGTVSQKARTLPKAAASRGSGTKIPSARKARHIFRLSLFWRFFKKSACLKSSARYKIYLPQEASDTVSERGKSKISAKHVQLTEKGKLQCSTE